ncbi:MAG: ATP-binding cassette domain-containing protein [Deferribacterales bacterium]
MENVLEIRDLTCGYKSRDVVKNISLSVKAGEILCILGPNGVGKTTFFKAMMGFIGIRAGEILLKGRNIRHMSFTDIANTVGYVPQSHTPPFPFSVIDVVTMGRTSRISPFASPSASDIEIAENALDSLGISHLRDKVYTEISGGERQLVLISRAIAQEPEMLVMDEPTSNLDFGNQIRVLDSINRLSSKGLGIVMTTHFPNHAFLSGNRVALMKHGEIIDEGSPDDVINESSMRRVYGIDVKMMNVDEKGVKTCVPLLKDNNEQGEELKKIPFMKLKDITKKREKEESMTEMKPLMMPETRLVTDMAGRKVLVKSQINSVFGYNPMVTAVTFCLAPEKIAGLNMPPMPPERMMADEQYLNLPVLGIMGELFGGGVHTFNPDAVKKAKPDVIISLSLSKVDEIEVQTAEKFQAELNIPVLIYDGALDRSGDVIRRIGDLLGVSKRAEELASYFDEKYDRIKSKLAKISAKDRKTVYYAQSPTGLLTEPRGARHGEVIDFAGGVNAAEVFEQRGCGKTKVSADDLLRWNPDVIIIMSDEMKSKDRLINRMPSDPFWSCIKAVKKGHIYEPPGGMYGWFDRPPSVNRIIGLIWMTHVLYPDTFKWDMVSETREFYKLFYRISLSEKQAETMLGPVLKK